MSENNKIAAMLIIGGVHNVSGIEIEPAVSLIRWSIRECERTDGTRTRHLVGYNPRSCEGRVSSDITELNLEARTARTKSGRIYSLKGDPGQNSDAEYVWQQWLYLQKAKNDKDVTTNLWSKSYGTDVR